MQLARVVPRGNYIREQVVFQFCPCEVALTQAGDGQPGCPMSEPIGPESSASLVGVGLGADTADAKFRARSAA